MTRIPTIDDVRAARPVLGQHFSPAPLIRSFEMERALSLSRSRRIWLKDYGWTPVGSFKLMGALYWMDQRQESIGARPVAAHSSGNFAAGLAYAGMRYQKRVIIVMPHSAPRVKFQRTESFGAEIRTYDITTDHLTGARDRMAKELAEQDGAVLASPYDDPDVIAGNGVGGLEIAEHLLAEGRSLSHFICPVSGGGLMAGHALAIAHAFPEAKIIGVEPAGADDFRQSLTVGKRVRIDQPVSICDGLLSYDVGAHNWPILERYVRETHAVADDRTCRAMRWIYDHHGLRTEPSGAIGLSMVLDGIIDLTGDGDIVVVLSGRNIDEDRFQNWIS